MSEVKLNNNKYKLFVYNFKNTLIDKNLQFTVDQILTKHQDSFSFSEEHQIFTLDAETTYDSYSLGVMADFIHDVKLKMTVVFDKDMDSCLVRMEIKYKLFNSGSNGILNTYRSDDLKTFNIS